MILSTLLVGYLRESNMKVILVMIIVCMGVWERSFGCSYDIEVSEVHLVFEDIFCGKFQFYGINRIEQVLSERGICSVAGVRTYLESRLQGIELIDYQTIEAVLLFENNGELVLQFWRREYRGDAGETLISSIDNYYFVDAGGDLNMYLGGGTIIAPWQDVDEDSLYEKRDDYIFERYHSRFVNRE
jgi:hypothetical protein